MTMALGVVIALGVVVCVVMAAAGQSLLSNEVRAWLPYLARWLVRSAARRLQEKERDRYEEEWLAELAAWSDRPLSGLVKAAHIRWRAREMRASLGSAARSKHRADRDAPVGNIFICYRHEDSSAYAGQLADELGGRLGKEKVFRDAGSQRGVDFRHQLAETLDSCTVLIAVIGPRWLMVQDESGRRRIDHPHDLVALEIATALERDIWVIPVLVAGARMPREADLPRRLAGLAYRSALELADAGWDHQISGLLEDLNQLFGSGAGRGFRSAQPRVSSSGVRLPASGAS